nr:hypothetical protein [Tanacetum cinerariifolium]
KTIDDEVRIQALIDEKRVNIKESSIHRTLKLDDAEGDMSHHKDIYDNPSLTKKVFANLKRVGTGFSGVVTPLFENMLVPAAKELKGRVDKLEEENMVLKELHSVHSKVDTVAPVVEKEKSSKQERIIAEIDEDVEINLEK